MSIPNEIKIGILGAGGKMGMRIGANLKKLPNEIFYIENAEAGIKRLEEIGIEVSVPTTVMDQLDFLILAVPDIYINKITTEVVPDMKSDGGQLPGSAGGRPAVDLWAADEKRNGALLLRWSQL